MRVVIKRAPDGKITLQETSKMAIVTINRLRARNALTANMWEDLARLAEDIPLNPKNKVVILRGTDGQFTSGSDIKEFSKMSVLEANQAFESMEKAISAFEKISIPVICAIDGPAMGAGFVLSLACDMRIGTPRVQMGIPVGRLGITLGPSFVRRIIRYIGPSRTKELVYTGRLYDSNEANVLGLLNRVVESDALDETVLQIAQTIVGQSRASLEAVKKSVELCEWKADQPWEFVDSNDFPEGCKAFIEKRKPKFK